ncbi:MAG: ThuA domain-containing protein, partial [bacterium]|nr:ThuA domain-containing protein [bacterium]
AFTVRISDADHPITKGMTDYVSATDELYHRQTPCASMKVLATVYSDPAKNGTGDDEPAAVWTTYGEGRCFNNILGHDVEAMEGVGYRTLMLRGTEWAATGAVTIPVPEEWPAANRPIKAAVITGGHGFDEAAFPPLFQGHDDIECTILPQEDDSEIFEDITDWPYDVIVLYNMSQKISAKRRQNLLKLLNQGVGVVGLHHAIAAFKEWPTFEQIIGARYFLKDTVEGNVTHPRSTYEHDVDFVLHVEDPSHPITRGLRDFQVHDETYNDWLLLPDVQ